MTLLPFPQILPYQDPQNAKVRGLAAAGYGHISLAAIPWRVKEEESENGVTGIKASSTRRVVFFDEDVGAANPMRLYAKRNLSRTSLKGAGYRIYRSKGRREWDVGWELLRRGFLTGRPVIVAERRAGGIVQESFLVTEAIAAESTLRDHLRGVVLERGEDPTPLIAPLATFIHELHGAKFYHDDLSADHIWVRTENGVPRFGLIDLDQSRFRLWLTERHRRMNLFQVLRSTQVKLLNREARLKLLEVFYGPAWPSNRDTVLSWLTNMESAKGARDVLGR